MNEELRERERTGDVCCSADISHEWLHFLAPASNTALTAHREKPVSISDVLIGDETRDGVFLMLS